jgi:Ca2+:H+ antiporter
MPKYLPRFVFVPAAVSAAPFIAPPAALAVLALAAFFPPGIALAVVCALALVGAVLSAVHHAEVVAHRVGEPYGSLVLALAITIIEVALIISLMKSGGWASAALARDTLYATVMIICNGVVGVCLLLGGLRFHEQSFQVAGTGPALAALVALSTLSLVMPVFTTSSPEGTYTTAQLVFVAVASAALWAVFVFVQTVRHRGYFLPAEGAGDEEVHAPPPSTASAWLSLALMLAGLLAVVGLAKRLAPVIEQAVAAAGAPKAVVGMAVSLLVLLPETWAAVRAARANRLQTSLNLALGSAMASIGLTVPAVVVAAMWLKLPLLLGLEPKAMALLAMTFLVSAITLGSGRTYVMQGAVHLVVLGAFVFLALVP